ncbi:Pentatricopeptide repeat-containing protein [Acorus calamus]|uniref:Pentatricopeptide repeat-containing protein n=1 Tax=Acorus calamus TaxID=4465 RepID=A0AAV9BYQ1_ACOCL|nr:Pentatricopeptide repeat-containing protein [Acorus calamus]
MASLPLPPTPNPSLPPPTNTSKTNNSLKFNTTHLTKLHHNHHNPNPQTLYKSYFHQISSLCKQGLIQQAFSLLNEIESQTLQIGPEIYGELLQGCVYKRAVSEGLQIHARILKNGALFAKNDYIETKLIIFYAKCDLSAIADGLFRRQRGPNVFSWAAMIGLSCRNGLNKEALMGFVEMLENGFSPDNFVVPNALKACSALRLDGFGRCVHGYVVKMGFGQCVFVSSSLVDFYGKNGELVEAQKAFDGMSERNNVAWNSILMGYVQNGLNEEAMEVFYNMRIDGVEPTRVSVSGFLSASAGAEASFEGRQGHAVAVLSGLRMDDILGSSIINFYVKVGSVEDAEIVFDRMVERDIVTWNLLISGYVKDGQLEKAINACRRMRWEENLRFDSVTLSSILTACADSGNLVLGKEAHCFCIRNSLESDSVVANCVVGMYAKCERIENARRVFNRTKNRDLVLWNSMIAAYARLGFSGEALNLVYRMQLEGVPPSTVSWNAVILGFTRNGQVEEAKDMFLQMGSTGLEPNLVTWTTLINGLAQNGYGHEAVQTFHRMRAVGIRPNGMSIVGLLSACTSLASLDHGRVAHGYAIRGGFLSSSVSKVALVDMYAKCGSITSATNAFEKIPNKELALYNTMISAYALHGEVKNAFSLLRQMQEEGIEADGVTFTCLLMAFDADARMLGSLVDACREHGEIALGEYLLQCLFELEPGNLGNYVAPSKRDAESGRWGEALRVRKDSGRSWIHVDGDAHAFVTGDGSHPRRESINGILKCLEWEMRGSSDCSLQVDLRREVPCS